MFGAAVARTLSLHTNASGVARSTYGQTIIYFTICGGDVKTITSFGAVEKFRMDFPIDVCKSHVNISPITDAQEFPSNYVCFGNVLLITFPVC